MQVYESERYLNEYLLFHYGEATDVLAWDFGPKDAAGFAARCVSECIETVMTGGSSEMRQHLGQLLAVAVASSGTTDVPARPQDIDR